jgi:dolichyl-phosphate-mannose--protein O-mannosyl transferase
VAISSASPALPVPLPLAIPLLSILCWRRRRWWCGGVVVVVVVVVVMVVLFVPCIQVCYGMSEVCIEVHILLPSSHFFPGTHHQL